MTIIDTEEALFEWLTTKILEDTQIRQVPDHVQHSWDMIIGEMGYCGNLDNVTVDFWNCYFDEIQIPNPNIASMTATQVLFVGMVLTQLATHEPTDYPALSEIAMTALNIEKKFRLVPIKKKFLLKTRAKFEGAKYLGVTVSVSRPAKNNY